VGSPILSVTIAFNARYVHIGFMTNSIIPDVCDRPLPAKRAPKRSIPDGACDCHFHVFDTPSIQVSERTYTALDATVDEYMQLRDVLGLARGVLVQPSVYGLDNETTLRSASKIPNVKSVVVIDQTTPISEIQRLADAGAVGCRVNLLFPSDAVISDLRALALRIADFGWHLQILADVSNPAHLIDLITSLPVPVMFDHLGHFPISTSRDHASVDAFLRLLGDGKIWTKISAPYRTTGSAMTDYYDVGEFVTKLTELNPDNLVWGTDWPHPKFNGPMPDDTDMLDQFMDWVPNAHLRHKILVENPERFYQF
jgi:predicted TIM-barrel fold metal-dependent hydrolase